MNSEIRIWTLDELIVANKVKLGRGDIISKKDIASFPGDYPIYSSAREKNGTFGFYGKYMFDEELITWSIDGGGRLFYRPAHKFSVTNVGGTLRILDNNFLNCRYLHLVLTHLHSKIQFDWVYKAHPSVIRAVYSEIPIPSLELQLEIVKKLDSAFEEVDLLLENLRLAETNFNDLLQSILHSEYTTAGIDLEPLEELVDILDNQRVPVNALERLKRTGDVPYYGATGQVGTIDKAIYNETLILLGEDGVPFFDPTKHKAYEITGPSWVNNHAHVLRARSEKINQRYLLHFLNVFNYSGYVNGATRLKLTQGDMKRIPVPVPSLRKQGEIVEKLDAAFAEIEKITNLTAIKKDFALMLRQSLLSEAFSPSAEMVSA